jgi:hypothetical protein
LLIRARLRGVYSRVIPVLSELGAMALKILEHVAPHIPARGDGEHVEQAVHCRAAPPAARLVVLVQRLAVQEIQSQEGTQPFVKRLLVDDRFRAGSGSVVLLP